MNLKSISIKVLMRFERLIICSNTLIGGGQLLVIDGIAPLIIENEGTGFPVVTINTSTRIGSEPPAWNTYVFRNRPNHPAVRVELNNQTRGVSVRALGKLVLDAQVVDQAICVVGALDFRPIGLDIYGDANSLIISGNQYYQNMFQGASFMLNLTSQNPYAMQ